MASEVGICNMALSKIRAGSINSLTEASLQAQQCKLWYPFCRDFLLEDNPWGFATKIAPLAVLGSEDIHNWVYVYQYPSDCLYIERLILNYERYDSDVTTNTGALRHRLIEDLYTPDLGAQVRYEIFNVEEPNGKVIAANEPELLIEYRFRVTDPNRFTMAFIEALAAYLASKIAIAIVGAELGRQFRKDALDEYVMLLSAAVSNSKNEEYIEPVDSDFILVRA